MAVFSSKNGKVAIDGGSDIAQSRGWSLDLQSDNKSYATNASGGIKREPGHQDFSGSFRFYQDSTTDIEGQIREGDQVTLRLYEDGTRYWTAPVIIDSITVDAENESADLVAGTVNFSRNGDPTAPS